jgi:hypothetical protein
VLEAHGQPGGCAGFFALYPQVPSHHLAELATRLDPFFEEAGVQPWAVP